MKILITGGAGFIGSNIAEALNNGGHEILIVDNLATGSLKNLDSISYHYVDKDINSCSLPEIFDDYRPEIVIHNAAQVSVGKSVEQPIMDQEVNIRGTINVLECCIQYKVKKIIYPSSAAVYGTPSYLPIKEEHPINPDSFYGISKFTPEMYIKSYSQLYGLDYTILRYSNVYGPRQDHRGEGGVISIFVNKILNGQSPIVLGDGNQTRDFIYIEDIVSANLAALHSGSQETFNISSNTVISLNQLVETLMGISGGALTPIYMESRPGDIRHSQLDNSKAIRKLSWRPKFELELGLTKTFNYYKLI